MFVDGTFWRLGSAELDLQWFGGSSITFQDPRSRDVESGRSRSERAMNESDQGQQARESVAQALERVERGERNALAELREALCGYVGTLRKQGLTRELTVDTVRTLVRTPRTEEGTFGLLPTAREALVELSVQWCAEEYDRVPQSPAPETPTQDRTASEPIRPTS